MTRTRALLLSAALFALPAFASGTPAPEFELVDGGALQVLPSTAGLFDLGAPDAGVALPALPAGVPSLDQAPVAFVALLVNLAQQGRWGLFAALAIFGATFVVRKVAAKFPTSKFGEAILSKWGGWATNFVLSAAAGVSTMLVTGIPVNVASVATVLFSAVGYTLMAAGLREFQKDAGASRNAAADSAGEKAAGEVKNLDDAADVLRKGPPSP